MKFQEMITLVVLSLLLIPGILGGETCTKNANTDQSSTYFCSGHCCGSPVGNDCCFDGIAQTFTIIMAVVGFCLLLIGIVCWVRSCKNPESDGRVQPQDSSEYPSSQSASDQPSKRKLGVVQQGADGPTPNPDSEGGQKLDPDSTGGQKLDPNSTGGQKLDPDSTGGQKLDPNSAGGQKLDPDSTDGKLSSAKMSEA